MTHDRFELEGDPYDNRAERKPARRITPSADVFEPAGLYTLQEIKRFTGRDLEAQLRAITHAVVIIPERPRFWGADIILALKASGNDTR